jgi:hypothetical protein
MRESVLTVVLVLCPALSIGIPRSSATEPPTGLTIQNGWYVHNGRVVWGYGQHNGWWRPGQRANLTRNAPGDVRPNRTEDLDKLADAMLRFGYPGFEHNFGLWYDRRRDRHDTARRTDANVIPPFLEQPWARSGQGTAWDGLSKYDLTKYNNWYFDRLKTFADLCDRKGTILFHNGYMQHALLETNAHYVDFPWRPANCIQQTELPDQTPVANAFYDVSHVQRRQLHRAYIRKCLDTLGDNTNVVFLCSEEYTGPLSFMRFWLDNVFEWEKETGRDIHVAVNGTKDVVDAVLDDELCEARISTIDLRYWWYQADGSLFAPPGGHEVAGRFTGQFDAPAEQIHRQVREYRDAFPDKAILHLAPGTRQKAWAALMAGGSMLINQLPYPDAEDPQHYISPEKCLAIQPTYDFIRNELSTQLPQMKPCSLTRTSHDSTWCLADPGRSYLVYAMNGGRFQLDLSAVGGRFQAKWFDPRQGTLSQADESLIKGGGTVTFSAPDAQDWALWLERNDSLH